MAEQSQPTSGAPSVFVLKTEEHFGIVYDSTHSNFHDSMASTNCVLRPRKVDTGKRYLMDPENRTVAILIVDVPASKSNVSVLSRVKDCVRERSLGPFMTGSSNFIPQTDANKAWKNDWDLDWRFGNYISIGVRLNRTTPTFFTESGPGSYTKKAEFLRSQVHVDLNKDSLYDHYDNSWVPFTKLESGWIGYGGRVNDEPGPKKSAMEMCTFTSYVAGSDRICCWISYPRNVPYASIYPVIQMAVHFMGENLRIIGMEKQWKNGELE